jgi:acetylornithine deacetylase/succinyl-diaminopimelate desuccinylase-like protein
MDVPDAERLIELTRTLIRLHPTPGAPTQNEALGLLADSLERAGAEVERLEYDDSAIRDFPSYVDVAKLGPTFATHGTRRRSAVVATWMFPRPGPSLALNGHVDVELVADPTQWRRPLGWRSGAIVNERVEGRGAADMLGGVASLVVAVERLVRMDARFGGELSVHLVVDEELGGNGSLLVLSQLARLPDVVLIAEPTSNLVCRDTRSFVQLRVDCVGHPRHMTMSSAADNAVWQAAQVVACLETLNEFCVSTAGAPGSRYVCSGEIRGGTDAAVPADTAEVLCTLALPPSLSTEIVLAELETLLVRRFDGICAAPRIGRHGLSFPASSGGSTDLADRLGLLLEGIDVAETRHEFPSACDARLYEEAGIPSIIFGPGDLLHAHAVDESVAIDSLIDHNDRLTVALRELLRT